MVLSVLAMLVGLEMTAEQLFVHARVTNHWEAFVSQESVFVHALMLARIVRQEFATPVQIAPRMVSVPTEPASVTLDGEEKAAWKRSLLWFAPTFVVGMAIVSLEFARAKRDSKAQTVLSALLVQLVCLWESAKSALDMDGVTRVNVFAVLDGLDLIAQGLIPTGSLIVHSSALAEDCVHRPAVCAMNHTAVVDVGKWQIEVCQWVKSFLSS